MLEAVVKMNADTVLPNRTRIIYGVKNDAGTRFIDLRVTVAGNPINMMGGNPTINFRRPDGEKASFAGTVNADGTLRLPVQKWALDIPGEVVCSATMTNGNLRLSTTDFYIMANDAVNGDDGTSDPSIPDVPGGTETVYVGIASVEQTKESDESGGENVWKMTLTDGSTAEFVVKNGKEGKTPEKGVDYFDGTNGKDGKTPVKGVDYFDGTNGKDGVSPTISVTAITGGHRITITDKNGTKTVDVMDGADGEDGADGSNGTNGKDGANGKDGRGIKSIARTNGNGSAGTTDTYTITYTDNATTTFTVYNGKNGTNGTNGTSVTVSNVQENTASGGSNVVTFSDGKTLNVKNGVNGKDGKDYVLTEADKAEIVRNVIESLGGQPVFGYVDENNNIILSGNLEDDTYSVKYEKEDGEMIDIGELSFVPDPVQPTYTNLVPTAINLDKTILDGVGYRRDVRWSSSNVLKDSAGNTAIGLIPAIPSQPLTVYVYGLDFNGTTADLIFACSEISNGAVSNGGYYANLIKDGFTSSAMVASMEKLADHYYKITTISLASTSKYFAISGATVDSIVPIVTINEPIL